MDSPCLTCTKVKNPKDCTNVTCADWRAWWLDRWNKMRANVFAKNYIKK